MSNAKKNKDLGIYHRDPKVRGIVVSNTRVDEGIYNKNQEKE